MPNFDKRLYIVIMRTLIKDILSVRKDLYFLLLVAVFSILLTDFVLDEIPELFEGGYKLGVIIRNLSLAFIAGFIFYFLTIHIKSENDKRKYNEVIGQISHDIVIHTDNMVTGIINHKNPKERKKYNSNLLHESCREINAFKKNAPIHWADDTQGNWLDYLYYYMTDVNKDIKRLNDRLICMEPEHSTLVARIENSLLLSQINSIYNNPVIAEIGNLSLFATSIELYLNLINDLRDYIDENLKDFKSITSESIGYKNKN